MQRRQLQVERVPVPHQRRARTGLAATVDVVAPVDRGVGVAGQLVARIAHAQAKTVFLQRQAGAEAHVPALVALGHGRQPRAEPEFAVQQVRRTGHVLEQAADRAGAVQRALRSAQHFDAADVVGQQRSEEHTSELQSLMRISYAVFCLKKKNNTTSIKKSVSLTTTKLPFTFSNLSSNH